MKRKRRFKKRYIPIVMMMLVLGCNASGIADMRSSKASLEKKLAQANINNYKINTIHKNGHELFFAQASNLVNLDSSPVFIFSHGTPGALSNSMAYLCDSILLSKGLVVAYDRPGFGNSDFGKATTTLKEQAEVLKILMDQYVGRDIYLVGHSYGAPVILQAAMDFPEEVAGLVWLGGIVQEGWRQDAWWRGPLKYAPLRWFFPSSMNVSNKEMIGLAGSLDLIKNRWKEVTCPVVMIQGTEDWLATPANTIFADSMLGNTAYKETVFVEGKSHFFYFSDPSYVVSALVDLLAQ